MGWFRRLPGRWLRRHGFDLVGYPLWSVVHEVCPALVLDVGGNRGQFGHELRYLGYDGPIVSFEPLPKAFATLTATSQEDPAWTAYPYALGDDRGIRPLNVASNLASSSLFRPSKLLIDAAPFVTFGDTVDVEVQRLDEVLDTVAPNAKNALLKVDTQGFERNVIEGARGVLDRIGSLLLELSMVPMYVGEAPADSVMAGLREIGFVPGWFYPAFRKRRRGRWLQADVLFVRDNQ